MEHIKLILLIASFLFPLGLSIALFVESKHNTSRRIMAITLLNTSVLFILNYLYILGEYKLYIPLHSFHAALEFWIFPCIYLYIKSIIVLPAQLKPEWVHFLPGMIMLALASYIFYGYSSPGDLEFFLKMNREGYHFSGFNFTVLIVSRFIHLGLVVVQGIVYTILFMYVPKHYNERLRNEFSNIESFSLDWINRYNLSFISFVSVGFISYAVLPLKGIHLPFIIIIFFLFSVYVCVLGIVSLKQQKTDVNLDEIDMDNYQAAESVEIKDELLLKKLKNYMEKKQAFLQPDLSLTLVCRELGTNRTYLSALINQQFGMNFNAYINQYRVDFVKEYLKEHPNTSQNELYTLAGFGSISTMKRALRNVL